MRFVVLGAGAVGGVVGGRLHQAGEDVLLIARGAHRAAIEAGGLRLVDPTGEVVLAIPVVDGPDEVTWRAGDVVLLAVKGHQTVAALDALARVAPPEVTVACLQNGIANEDEALRRFGRVLSVVVQLPAGHLEPGVVAAYSVPVTGMLDLGPLGGAGDDDAERVAAALRGATFRSDVLPDIARWKRRKLLLNLTNAAEALCGPDARAGELAIRALEEGEEVLAAAGLEVASAAEDRERRGDLLQIDRNLHGTAWVGGSSWQSLARGSGRIEADLLNGEIVLRARRLGRTAPVNELLQREANRAAAERRAPGTTDEAELLARLPLAPAPPA